MQNRPKHILVVEDEQPLRELYIAALQQSGFEVDVAEDGQAGWERISKENKDKANYDVIITDNNMPRLSGLDLVQRIHAAGIRTPVIMASSASLNSDELVYVSALLTKPFTMQLLMERIMEVLSQVPSSSQATNG